MDILYLLGMALVLEMAIMSATWMLSERLQNAGIVDAVWSYSFTVLAMAYALFSSGWAPRRVVLTGCIVIWSCRLGTHIYHRIRHSHPQEDSRYAELRKGWGTEASSRFFRFFQKQGLAAAFLSLPFAIAMNNAQAGFTAIQLSSVVLWLIGISGEAIADAQLAEFKDDPLNRAKTCQKGLWYYSRHPNYFFEFVIWVAFALFATDSPWGILGWVSPALMYYFLVKVTGIPAAEQNSLRSRGEEYAAYQRTTSAFIPWPKKRL